jgi:hypothetical protein
VHHGVIIRTFLKVLPAVSRTVVQAPQLLGVRGRLENPPISNHGKRGIQVFRLEYVHLSIGWCKDREESTVMEFPKAPLAMHIADTMSIGLMRSCTGFKPSYVGGSGLKQRPKFHVLVGTVSACHVSRARSVSRKPGYSPGNGVLDRNWRDRWNSRNLHILAEVHGNIITSA